MDLFATSSLDGTINMYFKHNFRILRTFYNPSKDVWVDRVWITENPLPSVIGISNNVLFSHSLNGQFLIWIKDKEGINNPIFIEKFDQTEVVIYGTNWRHIVVWKLPFFEEVFRYMIPWDLMR